MATNPQEFSNPAQNQIAAQQFCELTHVDYQHNGEIVDIAAIDDAIRLLNEAATRVAGGSMTVWKFVDHARRYLEEQIEISIR
jgi:hypothetical protein